MPKYQRDTERFLAYGRLVLFGAELDYVPCTYCGMPATDREHVFPQTHAEGMDPCALNVPRRRFLIVPGCRECNVLAATKVFPGIQEKRAYIHAALKKRYAKYLAIPFWSEDDLAELSPALAGMVRRNIQIKKIVRKRLSWMGKSFADTAEKE